MAPIRRYLRITKYSVLEVRIYIENPALAQSWLLNPRDPVLPRIIEAIRPWVLPKLREENERAKGKSKKKKGVKDTVVQDDFEVSIYLTELSSRHSLLTKQKDFREKGRIKSNSSKLTGWLHGSKDQPVAVDEDDDSVQIRMESDDEDASRIEDFPETDGDAESSTVTGRSKRVRFEEEVSDDEGFLTQQSPATKRAKGLHEREDEDVDKKKLLLNTSYEGFSIYGRILCLVVKQRSPHGKMPGAPANADGQQMLESWVSTQAAQEPAFSED